MHSYRKIFHKNTIKISYSRMPTIKSKLETQNKKILNKLVNQNTQKCNCINKNTSPLNGSCLLENILHIATIKSDEKNYQPRNYKGISESTFKKRKRSFNINRYINDTKLSVSYWNLKAGNSKPKVTWTVTKMFSSYNPQSNRCSLCLSEKFQTLEDEEKKLLNKKSEVMSKYRHQNKYMLRTLVSKI